MTGISRKNQPNRFSDREELWPLLLEAVSLDNILPLTSACNLYCTFCSHLQNPPEIKTYYFSPLSLEDLRELIPFLDGSRKIVLGESSTRLCEGEPLTHPRFLDVLQEIRTRFPESPLQVTTNGTLLKEELLRKLRDLAPAGQGKKAGGQLDSGSSLNLELVISLNSASRRWRFEILGDREPVRALEGVRLCSEYGIPFHGSIVAVPHLTGWEDLQETLFFLDQMGALTTRVFLPGYTRFASVFQPFDASLWQELHNFLEKMAADLKHPVVLEPPLKKNLLPIVAGVVPFSPASRAGLKRGDLIARVNGEKVISAVDAFYCIKKAANPLVELERNVHNGSSKPYFYSCITKKEGEASGLVVAYDLGRDDIVQVKRVLDQKGCKEKFPCLLTSRAAAPLWDAAQRESLLPRQLLISPVQNRFFGGSICCAGLLTVADFKKHLKELILKKTERTGLVIVPLKPFDRRGLDLRGEHYNKLPELFPDLKFVFL